MSNGNEAASGVVIFGKYFNAVEKLEDILEKARSIYLDALREGRRWEAMIYEPLSNFSRLFVLNATIVDWHTLMIGHSVYRYVVVRLYDSADKFSFEPMSIGVDDILVEQLPRNKTVTYTGVVPHSYLVRYKGMTCRAELVSPGFVEATHRLTVRAHRIYGNVYLVGLAVSEKLGSTAYVDTVWLVLVKQ